VDAEKDRRILIVDDSRTMRRMVASSLARLGRCRFEEAASGLEAIERLVMGPADLMVLDLNMPEMHGLELLRFVRAKQAYASMPVVVLTTKGDESSRTDALMAGANLFLTKPFSSSELEESVRALLQSEE